MPVWYHCLRYDYDNTVSTSRRFSIKYLIQQTWWVANGRLDVNRTLSQNIAGRMAFEWRHNERDNVSNHQHLDCFLKRLFRRKSRKISKLHVTGLCEGKPQVTLQRASNAGNVFIWWRHHGVIISTAHWMLCTVYIPKWHLTSWVGMKIFCQNIRRYSSPITKWLGVDKTDKMTHC